MRFTSAPPKTMHWLAFVAMGVVLGVLVLFASNAPIPPLPNHAQEIGYRFGYFIWPFLIAGLVAWLAAGRKKNRNPNLFATLFCSIAVGISALAAVGQLRASGSLPSVGVETTDQKMSRLMREAAGLQPVRKHLFGESKLDTHLRDVFRDTIAINRQYQEAAHKLDTKEIAVLGTSASFADPDSAEAGLRELHARYDLDSLTEQRIQQLIENLKTRSNDLSPDERSQFLKGVDQGLAQAMPVRRKAIETEKAWVDSLDDIYSFARTWHSSITLTKNNHVLLPGPELVDQFNQRIRTMNSRRSEYVEAHKSLVALQSDALQKAGITREQSGAH